jgi:hypothetical protein
MQSPFFVADAWMPPKHLQTDGSATAFRQLKIVALLVSMGVS